MKVKSNSSFFVCFGRCILALTVLVLSFVCVSLPDMVAAEDEGDFRIDDYGALVSYLGEGGDVTVPAGVVQIDRYAFNGCTAVKSVVIPDGVCLIDNYAFSGCTGLESISLPANVSINDYAFEGCTSLRTIIASQTAPAADVPEADMPEASTLSVKAFEGCHELTCIEIPFGVEAVPEGMFRELEKLSEVKIPGSVKVVGTYAFYGCEALTTLSLSDGIEDIREYAFTGASIADLVLPNSVKSVGDYAFVSPTLKNVYINKSLKQIGEHVFFGQVLESIVVDPDNTVFDSRDNCNAIIEKKTNTLVLGIATSIIPDTVEVIGAGAFCSTAITEITIPGSVKTIGDMAFVECTLLKKVSLSEGLTDIGNSAFAECLQLNQITFPSTLKRIDEFAFSIIPDTDLLDNEVLSDYGFVGDGMVYDLVDDEILESLKGFGDGLQGKLVIPEGVVSFSKAAFWGTGITEVEIPQSVTTIGDWAFAMSPSLSKVTLNEGLIKIGDYSFSECINLAQISFPSTLEIIGEGAFCPFAPQLGMNQEIGLELQESLVIPEGITSVGNSAFAWTGITDVTIPESLIETGEDVFSGCVLLNSVTLSEGLIKIGDGAFANCIRLESIELPSSVEEIGSGAFRISSNALSEVGVDIGHNVGLQGVFTVPSKTVSIGSYAFSGSSISGIDFNDKVTSIAEGTFSGCKNIQRMTLPEEITSVGDYAFENCTGLKIIQLSDYVSSIGNYAFKGCSNLKDPYIPEGTGKIGNRAFSNCTNMTSIDFQEGVYTLGNYVFEGDYELRNVSLPESLSAIGADIFKDCSDLSQISVVEDSYAARWCIENGYESYLVFVITDTDDDDSDDSEADADDGDNGEEDIRGPWYEANGASSSYTVGSDRKVTFGGVVKADTPLTIVTLAIYDPTGVERQQKKYPNTTSYNLSDFEFDFGQYNLAAGTYTVNLWAKTDKYNNPTEPIASFTATVVATSIPTPTPALVSLPVLPVLEVHEKIIEVPDTPEVPSDTLATKDEDTQDEKEVKCVDLKISATEYGNTVSFTVNPATHVENVVKTWIEVYSNGSRLCSYPFMSAVSDFDIQLDPGEYVVLVGYYNKDVSGDCVGTGSIRFTKQNTSEMTDEELVQADCYALEIGFASGDEIDHVTQNISLPTKGSVGGSKITWTTNNKGVITKKGVVTRPEYETTVTLKATIKSGDAEVEKTFKITVREDGAEEKEWLAAAKVIFDGFFEDEGTMAFGFKADLDRNGIGKVARTTIAILDRNDGDSVAFTRTLDGYVTEIKPDLDAGDYTITVQYNDAKGKVLAHGEEDFSKEFGVYGIYIGTLTRGQTFTIKSKVSAAAGIASIKVRVDKANGKTELETVEVKPNTNAPYDLSTPELDNLIKFNKLKKGEKVLDIIVTDKNGESIEIRRSFEVVDEDVPVLTGNVAVHYVVTETDKLIIDGTLTASSKITSLTVRIVSNIEAAETVEPNKKSYNLSKIELDTSKIEPGEYSIEISACTSNHPEEYLIASIPITVMRKEYTDDEYKKVLKGMFKDLKGAKKIDTYSIDSNAYYVYQYKDVVFFTNSSKDIIVDSATLGKLGYLYDINNNNVEARKQAMQAFADGVANVRNACLTMDGSSVALKLSGNLLGSTISVAVTGGGGWFGIGKKMTEVTLSNLKELPLKEGATAACKTNVFIFLESMIQKMQQYSDRVGNIKSYEEALEMFRYIQFIAGIFDETKEYAIDLWEIPNDEFEKDFVICKKLIEGVMDALPKSLKTLKYTVSTSIGLLESVTKNDLDTARNNFITQLTSMKDFIGDTEGARDLIKGLKGLEIINASVNIVEKLSIHVGWLMDMNNANKIAKDMTPAMGYNGIYYSNVSYIYEKYVRYHE